MKRSSFSIKLLGILPLLVVCLANAGGVIEVSNAWVRALPPGQTVTAAFFTLDNVGQSSCRLRSVASDITERGEIHQHQHDDGMMRMRRVPTLEISANSSQVFAPGGYHIMLFGLNRSLQDGEFVKLRLDFANCDDVSVEAEARSPLRSSSIGGGVPGYREVSEG